MNFNFSEFFSTLNWVDYIVIIAFLRGAFIGYKEGVLPEILRVFVIVIILISSLKLSVPFADWVSVHSFVEFNVARILLIFAIGLGVYFLCKFIMTFLLKFMEVGDGLFFRILGLCVGVLRWAFILSLAFMLVDHSGVTELQEDIHEESVTGPTIAEIAPTALELVNSYLS